MNKIKELIIRKKLKYTIENIDKGTLIVNLDKSLKFDEDYKKYLYLLDDINEVIEYVIDVEFLFKSNQIKLKYNYNIADIDKIILVLDELREFVIENFEILSEIGNDENLKDINMMKFKFKERISKI
ncbi:MAG: hypothetical protein ACRC57_09280 [Sarcina sp.]